MGNVQMMKQLLKRNSLHTFRRKTPVDFRNLVALRPFISLLCLWTHCGEEAILTPLGFVHFSILSLSIFAPLSKKSGLCRVTIKHFSYFSKTVDTFCYNTVMDHTHITSQRYEKECKSNYCIFFSQGPSLYLHLYVSIVLSPRPLPMVILWCLHFCPSTD